ncbi:unnamed protein product [Owenia fusiformis]|uniref:Uncharacterized protein n=1 Tax=Owenia fusiformis TaxID=6347 RepID=A0A8J1UZ76_OWEFU|nr:unnamed protein product [Owenia fusiformis]
MDLIPSVMNVNKTDIGLPKSHDSKKEPQLLKKSASAKCKRTSTHRIGIVEQYFRPKTTQSTRNFKHKTNQYNGDSSDTYGCHANKSSYHGNNQSNCNRLQRNGQLAKSIKEFRKEYDFQESRLDFNRQLLTRNVREKREANQEKLDESITCIHVQKEKARKQFKKAIHLVLIVLTVKHCISHKSMEEDCKTATELHWHILHNRKHSKDKLVFDKLLFAREKSFARFPYWARLVTDQPAGDRSEVDCRRLHALLRGLRGFNKFTETIQLALCRSMSYVRVEPERVILRRGHTGIYFYFIFSGSVFINIQHFDQHGNTFSKTERVLTRGDSFGEVALLKDIPRTATVTCREECELLVIERDIFAKICPKIFDIEHQEKVDYIRKLPLLKSLWEKHVVEGLAYECQLQEHRAGKVVVANNTEDEWVHICMEGSCRIRKCLLHNVTIQASRKASQQSYRSPHAAHIQVCEQDDDLTTPESEITQRDLSRKKSIVAKERMLEMITTTTYTYEDTYNDRNDHSVTNDVSSTANRIPSRVVTPHSLICHRLQESGKHFIDIGKLIPGDIFDLANIVREYKRKPPFTMGYLTLVSGGCRLLRIPKQTFFKTLSKQGLDLIQQEAMLNCYPSEETILKLYKAEVKWNNYKHDVIREVILPHTHSRKSLLEKSDREYIKQLDKNVQLLKTLMAYELKEKNIIEMEKLQSLKPTKPFDDRDFM